MNYTETESPVRTRTIEESVRDTHQNLTEAHAIVTAILEELDGPTPSTNDGRDAVCGLIDLADGACSRTAALVSRLQVIRNRIAEPKVVPLAQTAGFQNAAAQQYGVTRNNGAY